MHSSPAISSLRRAALLWAAVGLAACGPSPQPAAGAGPAAPIAPVAVRMAAVGTARAARIVKATGSLHAEEEVAVAAEASGRIVSVLRDVGDAVAPGDLLARVDDTDAALARAESRRSLTEALAKLGLDALPAAEPDFETLPTVERARLEAENAKARLDRGRTLHERKPPLISDQDFDDLRTGWAVAESARRVVLLAARAQLAEARTRASQLDLADRAIQRTVHTVPAGERPSASGGAQPANVRYVVATRMVAVGDYVRVGDPLFRLVDVDPLKLRAEVPERRAEGLAVGRKARIETSGSAAVVVGTISRIRPEVDPRTRSVEVEILVPNADGKLLAGAFATAEIDVGEDAAVTIVPDSAVRTFAGVRKVIVVQDGKAVERVIVVGRRIGAAWEATSGVKAGDRIVLDPPASVVAGTPLTESAGAAPEAPVKPGGATSPGGAK
ncbi:MAG: efflux RND transporter periplasmic adaptor subunit [Planctomycetes bacterium]|nr:efflux RND transporter periplasmic adaptor subunit [Planctomycetota bacterium]